MTRRGMTVRTLACFGFGAALIVVVLLGALPKAASAGMLKCEVRFLDADDDMQLRAAALKVLPKSVHISVAGACRNPDWAYGFIETRKNVTVEGVEQWWELICRRDARMWKCEPPEFKQFIAVSISVGGILRPVELSFDKVSSLERARVLVARAIETYSDPASRLPSCGVNEPKESDLLGAKAGHRPLPTGENKIHVSVTNDAKESVTLDDVDVNIQFRLNANAASSEAACWWEIITVT